MQCTSYLPGYYHPKDLNGGLTGNLLSSPNNDITSNSGRGFYISLPPFVDRNRELAHQKEVLKQTILQQEAVFRYQVNELHRVHRRQRELMDQVKRRKLEDHLHLQALESKSFVSHLRSEISQKIHWPLADLSSFKLSALCGETIQRSSIAGQIVQPGANLFTEQNVTKGGKISSSKSSASRKRMLDLEFPAEEYLDNEDEEKLVEESPVEGPKILIPELQPQYSSKLNFFNPSSSPRSSLLMFDLNEPVQPDETGCPNSAFESINVHEEISNMDQNLSGAEHAECSNQKKEVTARDLSNLNSSDEVSSVESTVLPCTQTANSSPRMVDKRHDGTKTDKLLPVSPWGNFEEIPIAVQALPCFSTNAPLRMSPKSPAGKSLTRKEIDMYNSGASSPTSGTSGCSMKNSDNDHTSGQMDAVKFSKFSDSMNWVKGIDLNCTPSDDLSDDQFSTPISNISHLNIPEGSRELESKISTRNNNSVGLVNDSKALATKNCIDFSSIKEGTLSSGCSEATITNVDRDLEASVSPENKERSPPRGDSQDNLTSTSVQWCKGAHMRDHTREHDRAAAETLLAISSSAVQGDAEVAIGEPSEASHDSLGWLADIATSVASNPENEVGKLTNLNCHHNSLIPDRINCNDLMKLKPRGGNTDNYGHQLKKGKQKEAACNKQKEAVCNTLHSQPRRSQSRSANHQKVLQTEVPAASSVSLHQLNEDLLAIGDVKLHASATSKSGTWRTTPRRTSSRSRRWPHNGKTTTCSLLQSHCSNDKQGTTGRFWKCWGVTKGRQNDRRARSCISPLFS